MNQRMQQRAMRANRLRTLFRLWSFLVILLWATSAHAGVFDDFGVERAATSMPAPDFSLPLLKGGSEALSDLHGKVVLLHFWATWCGPCRQEIPQLVALSAQHKPGLVVLGVNVDQGNQAGVASFAEQDHFDFPCMLDAAGDVHTLYRVRALPTTYLIGRDGHIIGRIIGERDWNSPAARRLIDMLVGKGKKTAPGPVATAYIKAGK